MTKKKGKAIIGIALAAIMIASVFTVMMPMGSALEPEEKNVWQGNKGSIDLTALTGDTVKILRGEKLDFSIVGCTIYGYSEAVYGSTRGSTSDDYNTKDEFSEADCEYTWFVDVVSGDIADVVDSGYNRTNDVILSLEEPRVSVSIKDEAGKSIDSITVGQDIALKLSTNLFKDDRVDVKVRDPGGDVTKLISKENIAFVNTSRLIDTDEWDVGEHEIWVLTTSDGDFARGLDIFSDADTIRILKAEIDIEAATTESAKEDDVAFTVTAPPYTWFKFTTTHKEDVWMTAKENNPLGLEPGAAVPMDESDNYNGGLGNFEEGGFYDQTNEDGIRKFVVSFKDDRTYTFKVWFDSSAPDTPPTKTYANTATDEKEDIDIDVGKIGVTIDAPRTAMIGDDVEITVTAAAGKDVDIVIDDIMEFDDEVLVGGEATVEWDTKGKTVGSYTIEVFVNCDELKSGDVGKDVEDIIDAEDLDADETETIRLVEPGVTAEQPRDTVAEGDDYVIRGTATGVGSVDIVIIGPKGLTVNELGVDNGLDITDSTVSDNEFEEEISIPDGSDPGTYVAIVLIPGRDGKYAGSEAEDGAFEDAFEYYGYDVPADLVGKNQAQLLEIGGDVSFSRIGSDDQYAMLTFRVSAPYIEIVKPIATVGVGEPLVINMTTNREDDVTITVTSIAGPMELLGEACRVEDGKAGVTIDTADVVEGTYTIQAEDDDGNIDEATVTIGAAAAPTPTPVTTPTPTPITTPVPTPVTTATPVPTEEPTPTPEEPGFEAVFAIAGLLAVAYLVLRIKK